mmetsp:Transcript_11082/g.27989  ORF Transcript_11082/g.27989 Transcript_11082/m.27989 type:complete len:221 (-) Transcript_11082:25-687(-)
MATLRAERAAAGQRAVVARRVSPGARAARGRSRQTPARRARRRRERTWERTRGPGRGPASRRWARGFSSRRGQRQGARSRRLRRRRPGPPLPGVKGRESLRRSRPPHPPADQPQRRNPPRTQSRLPHPSPPSPAGPARCGEGLHTLSRAQHQRQSGRASRTLAQRPRANMAMPTAAARSWAKQVEARRRQTNLPAGWTRHRLGLRPQSRLRHRAINRIGR